MTLDEVQREPDLLRAVKRAIDRRRRPGSFLLTGSANLLLMRRVSESLAGRASYLTLWPMTRREQRGLGRCGLWDDLLAARDDGVARPARRRAATSPRTGAPSPAAAASPRRPRTSRRPGNGRSGSTATCAPTWSATCRTSSSIASLPDFRRLMRAACLRLGQLVNQTELGRDVALPQPTVHRYLNLLETSYLLVRLPAYAVNRTKRLIKSPKLYWGDTGVALHLAGER